MDHCRGCYTGERLANLKRPGLELVNHVSTGFADTGTINGQPYAYTTPHPTKMCFKRAKGLRKLLIAEHLRDNSSDPAVQSLWQPELMHRMADTQRMDPPPATPAQPLFQMETTRRRFIQKRDPLKAADELVYKVERRDEYGARGLGAAAETHFPRLFPAGLKDKYAVAFRGRVVTSRRQLEQLRNQDPNHRHFSWSESVSAAARRGRRCSGHGLTPPPGVCLRLTAPRWRGATQSRLAIVHTANRLKSLQVRATGSNVAALSVPGTASCVEFKVGGIPTGDACGGTTVEEWGQGITRS